MKNRTSAPDHYHSSALWAVIHGKSSLSGLREEADKMMLSLLRDLNQAGASIFLTTHNMEEANRLCHRVGIIRAGTLVAVDAPEKLKVAIEKVHRIEVSFDREIPGDALTTPPCVTSASRTGDKWQITAENRDAAIRSLVVFSQQHGATIVTDLIPKRF